MKNLEKKGQVMNGITALMTALAAIVIVVAVTFLIIANVLTQMATTEGFNAANAAQRTLGYNATIELQAAAATIPGWDN